MKMSYLELGSMEWALGTVLQQVAAGLEIELEMQSFPSESRQLASVHEGYADVSVNVSDFVRWAFNGEAAFDGPRHTSLRAIASVFLPQWMAIGTRWEARLTSLDQITGRDEPLRFFTYRKDEPWTGFSFVVDRLVQAHGFTLSGIEAAGGRVWSQRTPGQVTREGNFDVAIAPANGRYGLGGRSWMEAAMLHNLRYVSVHQQVLRQLTSELGIEASTMPRGLLRGVDEPVWTLCFPNYTIYASERLEDNTAYGLARALDRDPDRFAERNVVYAPSRAAERTGCPLHPGAERYYRERGYL